MWSPHTTAHAPPEHERPAGHPPHVPPQPSGTHGPAHDGEQHAPATHDWPLAHRQSCAQLVHVSLPLHEPSPQRGAAATHCPLPLHDVPPLHDPHEVPQRGSAPH